MKKVNFDVFGMTCSACVSHVQKAVSKLNGVKTVNVNLLTNSMDVEFDENICNENLICEAVKKSGYEAKFQGATEKSDEELLSEKEKTQKENLKKKIRDLCFSAVFLLLIMYFSMGNMMWGFKTFDFLDHHKNPMGFALIQFLLVLPIIFIYRDFFVRGFKNLFTGKPNMDTLIAIGAGVSVVYGIFALFMISFAQSKLASVASGALIDVEHYKQILMTYHDSLYFESAGMILTLVSLGKFLEDLSKSKTTKAITNLVSLAPKTAVVLKNDIETEILAKDVQVDDIVIVKKGFAIPVDGKIIDGKASINEANITGESIPVQKLAGDEVYSSTIVESGYIKIKATKVGTDTTFESIIKLVQEASNSKAPISKLADKISAIFVPVILSIALLTFVVNLLVSHSFELALNFAITVVVIACPCALGLATPVAIMVGTGKGAENGLLIKNAEIMEKAHQIKTVVFDKTGTITEGKPKVIDFVNLTENKTTKISDSEILNVVYSLENKSEHPLAKSLINFAKNKDAVELDISDFSSLDGLGLTAKIDNDFYYCGNIKFADSKNIDVLEVQKYIDDFLKNAKIPLILIKNNEIVAIFSIKDEIKPNSKLAIERLKELKIKTIMLTGDNKKTAQIIADQVKIDKFIAEVKPDEKQKVIKSLKSNNGKLVAMVGDGVNDAPALASADVGISIGAGSDVAIETSDIVLLKNDLFDVTNIIRLSKRVLATIKLGLFWAFFYNFICVIIATGVLYYPLGIQINPMIGALAMSISSVSVVLNALTINFFKKETAVDGKIQTKSCKKNNCENHKTCKLDDSKMVQNSLKNEKCKLNQKTQNEQKNIENSSKFTQNNAKNAKDNIELQEITKNQNELQLNKKEQIMEFYVKDMMCQNCVKHITKALENIGATNINIDLESKKVTATTSKSKEEVFGAVADAGYTPTEN